MLNWLSSDSNWRFKSDHSAPISLEGSGKEPFLLGRENEDEVIKNNKEKRS